MYLRYEQAIHDVGYQAIQISKAVAAVIDIDKYEKITTTKQRDDYFYAMQKYFKKVQEAEGAKYVYIERQVSTEEIEYVFDSEKDSLWEIDDNDHKSSYGTKSSSATKVLESEKWGSLVSGYTPILNKNGDILCLVGVDFEIPSTKTYLFTDNWRELYYLIILVVFAILVMAISHTERKRREKELTNFYKIVVNALTISLSKKSNYTSIHSENVAKYARILATKFHFNEKTLEIVYIAGLLHDIGKLGIAEQIIDKPSRLTDGEYEEIKKHPVYSREIIDEALHRNSSIFNIEEFKVIIDIASYHHERWDGNGYPYGLKGEEIPLTARIISIVDAYEAMTANRPYRQAMSSEKAMEEIKRNSGTQFDPIVVDRFIQCCTEKNKEFEGTDAN